MIVYSLATETYDGSVINVDLFPTEPEAYDYLARLILGDRGEDQARLNALLDRLKGDGTTVGYETKKAFEAELDATRWIGVVQCHDY